MIDSMASDHERLGNLLAAGLDHHRTGRRAEAARAYRAALALVPGQPDAQHLLGLLAHDEGDVEGAVERIAAALAARPEVAPFQASFERIVATIADRPALRRALERARARHPFTMPIAMALARVCLRESDLAGAARALRGALVADPAAREVALELAAIESQRGRRGVAEAVLESAAEHHPDDPAVQARRANLMRARGRREEAIDLLSRTLARHPDHAGLANDLAIALRERGNLISARRVLERAGALEPTLAPAWINLSNVLRDLGEPEASASALDRALALDPADPAARQNALYHAHFRPTFDGAAARRAAEAWAAAMPAPVQPAAFDNPRDPDRPLVVGFVSGDLRIHPVGTFLSGILPSIDRRRFRVVAYDAGGGADAVSERLRRHADAFTTIAKLDDAAAIDVIRADRIDVLVDLSGHTGRNRLGIFARRAAPVQATWLGYFGTTGLPAMDYLIADAVTVPPGEEDRFTERVRRLPRILAAFAVPDVALDPGRLPMGADRPPTFGCFNSLAKLSDRTVRLWARVMAAVPGARLVLKARQLGDDEVVAAVRHRLVVAGIPAEAVACEGPVAHADYLARYRDIDLVLDSTPFAGGTTTAEAMWMGVPSVRIVGDRFAGRFGESFLRAAGLDAFLCADDDAYVACAVDWTRRHQDLAALRATLRQRLFASAAGDVGALARDLEDCLRGMWHERCAAG